ncbi:hypothetical protein Tco_0055253, partial [Tanacetum coccineum]
ISVIPEVPAKVPIVPTDPLVAPKVGAVSVTSPTRVLDLVDYLSSDFDPSEDSLPPAPELPLVSPFLYSDDSKADSESEPAEQRPERHESLTVHDVMVSRWRDRVTSRPSSPSGSSYHDTFAPSYEFPVAPVISLSGIHFTSDSSSSGLSSDSSSDTFSGSPLDSLSDTSSVHSSGCDASVMTPRYSKAFSRWRSAPFSTPYPPTTSESSPDSFSERSLDSSSLSAGPSHKRCRSPTTLVLSSNHVSR